MSDHILNQLVKLAYERPEYRDRLLPLIEKTAKKSPEEEAEKGIKELSKSLAKIHGDLKKKLRKFPEGAYQFLDESALEKGYNSLTRAAEIAAKVGQVRMKAAFWPFTRKKYVAPLPRPRPTLPVLRGPYEPHKEKGAIDLVKVLKWLENTPTKESEKIQRDIADQRSYLLSSGKRNVSLTDIIPRDILKRVLKHSVEVSKKREDRAVDNPVLEVMKDYSKSAKDLLEIVHRDVVRTLERNLKVSQSIRGKLEDSLTLEKDPRKVQILRQRLKMIIEMQITLFDGITNFSVSSLKV